MTVSPSTSAPVPGGPLFSVVVPTCRRNDALAACLDQLTGGRQSLPANAYEVIVADDGPEDGNENAREMLRSRYPSVRWVAGPRRGPAANRNRGAAEARGVWLAFTDDDCVPQPGWLAAYAARLDLPDGPTPRVLEGLTSPGRPWDFGPFFTVPANDKGGLLWSCNFCIERGLFEELGGFDEGFPFPHLEDVDLRMRLQDRGQAFPFVPAAVVVHPPRPVHPLFKWVRAQESAFYLAYKRGIPVTDLGQGVMTQLRMWVFTLRACRSVGEAILASTQSAAAFALVASRWPFWHRKYRRMAVVAPGK